MNLRKQFSSKIYTMGEELTDIATSELDLNMMSGDILKILASIIHDDKLLIEFDNFLKLYTSYKIIEDVGMDNIIKLKQQKKDGE